MRWARVAGIAAALTIPAPAWPQARVDVRPNDEGLGSVLRPLDDSDPESRAVMERFFERTPCSDSDVDSVDGLCDDALALLRGGGDRLAHYLIRQVEASEAERFPNQATYLRLLGFTESEVAVQYLTEEVRTRGEAAREGDSATRDRYLFAIESLGRTRDVAVGEIALRILETSTDPEVQLRAINAIDRVQSKHGAIPGAAERIAKVRQSNA